MYFNLSGKNQTGEKNRETQIYDEVIILHSCFYECPSKIVIKFYFDTNLINPKEK